MFQKGFIAPVLILAIVLILLSGLGGFYLGRSNSIKMTPKEKSIEEILPQVQDKLNNEVNPSSFSLPYASESSQYDRDQMVLENIKSNKDLPEIAAAAIKDAIRGNDSVPRIEFSSNDGEYASVSMHFVGVGGGHAVFLVKRNGIWNVVFKGNGYGECSEILPIRAKYQIKKEFLPCGDEIGN